MAAVVVLSLVVAGGMKRLIIGGLVAVTAFAAHSGMAHAWTNGEPDPGDEVAQPWTEDDSAADRTPYVSCSEPVWTESGSRIDHYETFKERTNTCVGLHGRVLGPWVEPPRVPKPKSFYKFCGTLDTTAGVTRLEATLYVRAEKTDCRTGMAVARAERSGLRR